ncbi:DUF11 domain-containing protein [Lysobacter psychrotolerans]|uniref:DUF11 domain-containing protein n=2 Tax=Montanilutibacter psychrotolerans TaxID=1327343 RepID=A0A3M8SVX3_9GAMM|nr:DUF11 domain-containing protein [Lysobacter psychrotolerans]
MAFAGIAAVLVTGYAVAVPAANTRIGNQASASYIDPNGQSQIATSNLVETIVQQVGAFTLTPDNTKSAAAGNVVYMAHTLTNTGNGTDSFDLSVAEPADGIEFSRIEVFADANGDGLPDSTTPLCSSAGAPLCTAGFTTSVGGNGGDFKFVVAYTVPGTATLATWPTNVATVTADVNAGSPVLATYPTATATNDDTVNLTDQAAFSVTKSLQQPAVAAAGGGAWPTALTSGRASPAAGCSTTWGSGLTPGCTYTVYTLRYSNTGGAAGDLSVADTLQTGFTYVAGSAVWSSAPGTGLGDAVGSADDPAGITYESAAGTLRATIAGVAPNVSGTLSFVVLVNSTALVDDSNTNNAADYSPESCSDPLVCANATTNIATFDVLATYGVVAVDTSGVVAVDDVEDNPSMASPNLVVEPTVVAGGSVAFTTYVANTGNASDTFNITLGSSNFPVGTTFSLFKADGVTPVLDTNGDGISDTGPLAAGVEGIVVVRANVPASATVGSGPYSAMMTADSVGDTSTAVTGDDSVWVQVTQVVGSLVDLTNTAAGTGSGTVGGGDLGPGPSPMATTTNTTPAGTGTTFTLFIANNDSVANTYSLAASQSPAFPGSLPSGWTVTFHAAGGVCGNPTIVSIAVAAGAQAQVAACVTPPATATIATQNIYFQARALAAASNGGFPVDTKLDAVNVTVPDVWAWMLVPDNTGQVAPGGSIVYAHTLSNTGNQQCGTTTLTTMLSAADTAAGWTAVTYVDVNGDGQIDAGDTLITAPLPTLAGGAQTKILIKVFAPGGATVGSISTITVTATDADTDGDGNVCPVVSATDTTTVITGQVRLLKTQALDTNCDGTEEPVSSAPMGAQPGHCIVYKVIATNEGAAPVANVSINDAVPVYTNYAGATQPAAQCGSTGLTPALSNPDYATSGLPVAAVSCGSASSTLSPGGTVTLRFSVQVDSL